MLSPFRLKTLNRSGKRIKKASSGCRLCMSVFLDSGDMVLNNVPIGIGSSTSMSISSINADVDSSRELAPAPGFVGVLLPLPLTWTTGATFSVTSPRAMPSSSSEKSMLLIAARSAASVSERPPPAEVAPPDALRVEKSAVARSEP